MHMITFTGADPGRSLGSRDPLQKYIREPKRMMYWYKNTKMYYFLNQVNFLYFMR